MARALASLWLFVASLLPPQLVAAQPLPVSEQRAADASPEDRSRELFNRAAGYEQIGKLASAYRLFAEVADVAHAAGHGERALVARDRMSALAPLLSKLSIVVPAHQRDRVEVECDGSPVGAEGLGVAVPVDAGVHTIVVSGERLEAWWVEIRVPADPGEHIVFVPLLAEKALEPQLHSGITSVPPHDEPRMRSFLAPTHRKVALAAGSMGVLGVSAGTIFGMRAISKSDESDRLGCIGNVCPTAQGVDARRQAQISTNVATVSMIAGLTGLATAAVLFLLAAGDDADDARASSRVEPRVAKSSGELLWRGEF